MVQFSFYALIIILTFLLVLHLWGKRHTTSLIIRISEYHAFSDYVCLKFSLMLPFVSAWVHPRPRFLLGSVLLIFFSFLCRVFGFIFVLFAFVLCFVSNVAVSLLNVTSGFLWSLCSFTFRYIHNSLSISC